MKPIGGFFELEVPDNRRGPHQDAVALSTGRACLSLMIRYVKPKLVYVPFHSCDATYSPFIDAGIPIRFYGIHANMEPVAEPELDADEYFLWTNYYGVCSDVTERLKKKYGNQLLIDDTHAFFRGGHGSWWSFTSARKYFGVADGAYLFAPEPIELNAARATDWFPVHNMLRTAGRIPEAYNAFLNHEGSLTGEVLRISKVSELLLSHVDLPMVAAQRIANFNFLEEQLSPLNTLPMLFDRTTPPFCYPFLPSVPINRDALSAEGFFIPRLWSDVGRRPISGFDMERRYAEELLPLPVDHRYNPDDLIRLVKYLQNV